MPNETVEKPKARNSQKNAALTTCPLRLEMMRGDHFPRKNAALSGQRIAEKATFRENDAVWITFGCRSDDAVLGAAYVLRSAQDCVHNDQRQTCWHVDLIIIQDQVSHLFFSIGDIRENINR